MNLFTASVSRAEECVQNSNKLLFLLIQLTAKAAQSEVVQVGRKAPRHLRRSSQTLISPEINRPESVSIETTDVEKILLPLNVP